MRTLIVEDDPSSQLLLRSFLSEFGECDSAANGREAVEAFLYGLKHGQLYDLICMDIMMPEMDGNAALREIRGQEESAGIQVPQKAKVIMTTALNDAKNVVESLQASCDAYLLKPIQKKELLDHLKNLHLV
jgi:two-component system chemotaxis response regulator CheY